MRFFYKSNISIKLCTNVPPQENQERDQAEVKRRQREKLQAVAKRRSTATCSMRDKDVEGVALESVLQRFLTNRGSQRRSRTPSPTGISLTEITSQENCPVKETKKPIWSPNVSQASVDKENIEDSRDTTSKKPENKLTGPVWKKPASSACTANRASVMSAVSEEDGQTEDEAQKLREVSQKVLRYQSSRSSVSSGEFHSPISSPRRWAFQEDREKLLSISNVEDVPKPSPSPLILVQNSPSSIGRRHTIALPTTASLDSDGEEDTFVPHDGTPGGQHVPLGNMGKMRSVDAYLPPTKAAETVAHVSNTVSEIKPSEDTSKDASASEVKDESKTDLRQNKVPQRQTKEPFSFKAFFRRWGEKGKTNNQEKESSSVDP